MEYLPAYAPNLNPVEGLWLNLKGVELANLAGERLDEVIAAAERGIQRIRHTHHLPFSFLRYCGLSLWCRDLTINYLVFLVGFRPMRLARSAAVGAVIGAGRGRWSRASRMAVALTNVSATPTTPPLPRRLAVSRTRVRNQRHTTTAVSGL